MTECPSCGEPIHSQSQTEPTIVSMHPCGCDVPVDLTIEDDREMVYVPSQANGTGISVYHTDHDCSKLQQASSPKRRLRSTLPDAELCPYCKGETPHGTEGSSGGWQALEEMDPDELVTDGGQNSVGRDRETAEDDPVYTSLNGELKTRYPDWRYTSHYTPEGRKVLMIEFADDGGEFTSGLPGDFVSMVSEAYDCDVDTNTEGSQ